MSFAIFLVLLSATQAKDGCKQTEWLCESNEYCQDDKCVATPTCSTSDECFSTFNEARESFNMCDGSKCVRTTCSTSSQCANIKDNNDKEFDYCNGEFCQVGYACQKSSDCNHGDALIVDEVGNVYNYCNGKYCTSSKCTSDNDCANVADGENIKYSQCRHDICRKDIACNTSQECLDETENYSWNMCNSAGICTSVAGSQTSDCTDIKDKNSISYNVLGTSLCQTSRCSTGTDCAGVKNSAGTALPFCFAKRECIASLTCTSSDRCSFAVNSSEKGLTCNSGSGQCEDQTESAGLLKIASVIIFLTLSFVC